VLVGSRRVRLVQISVGDPDPEPDPHVVEPPGSGSISQKYGSGSGSGSYPFLKGKNIFFASLKPIKKGVGSGVGSGFGSIYQRYGSADPNPHQNVTGPQHWYIYSYPSPLDTN
jgi:hypothetical protein